MCINLSQYIYVKKYNVDITQTLKHVLRCNFREINRIEDFCKTTKNVQWKC